MTNGKERDVGITRRVFTGAVLSAAFVSKIDRLRGRVTQVDVGDPPKLIASRGVIRPDSDECRDLLKELFGVDLTQVSALKALAKANPYYGDTKDLSPSSLHAMWVVMERLGLDPNNVERKENLTTTSDRSLFAFGGPNNNDYTRAFLGTGGGSPLLGCTLPVMFNIEKPTAPRIGKEPTWGVLINGIDRDFLDDCLVITSLPNPCSASGKRNDRIDIIAGRYRAGMVALDSISANAQLLERTRKKIRGLMAWQILIPVKTIDQEVPLDIGEEQVFEIKANFDALRNLAGEKTLDALVYSAFATRPREELDSKTGVSGRKSKEDHTSPSEESPTRSAAMRRSGERARTDAPHQEQSVSDPQRTTEPLGSISSSTNGDRHHAHIDKHYSWSAISKRGEEIYLTIKDELEHSHPNQYVAINILNGSYALGSSGLLAIENAKKICGEPFVGYLRGIGFVEYFGNV